MPKVRRETRVIQDLPVLSAHRGQGGNGDLRVKRVLMECRVRLVILGFKEHLERLGLKVPQEPMALKEFKENLVHRDPREIGVILDCKGLKVSKVRRAPLVRMVLRDLRAIGVIPAIRVLRVSWVNKGFKESRGRLGPTAYKESRVFRVLLAMMAIHP